MLTQREVAADLRTTPGKARKQLERHNVPFISLGPRSYRVEADVYEQWKRDQNAFAQQQSGHAVRQRIRLKLFKEEDMPDFLRPDQAS